MAPKQKFIFAGVMLVMSMFACQGGAVPTPDGPTADTVPTSQASLPVPVLQTTSPEAPSLPPNFLTDPNTACAIRLFDGLSCLDRDGWHAYGRDSFKAPVNVPQRMIQCPDGRTYLYNGITLYVLKDGTLAEVPSDGLPDLEFFACGAEDALWVGYMEGVSHLSGFAWEHFTAAKYLGSSGLGDLVTSLAVAPNGKVWAATYTDIAAFDGTIWQIVKSGGSYDSLAVDANNNVWATDGQSLLKYDGVQWSTFPDPQNGIRFIALDRENRVWAATPYNKIYSLDPQTGSWTLRSDADQLGSGNYYALRDMRFDRQDRLWVSGTYGLGIYDGSNWTIYRTDNADLFANNADEIVLFGNGPQLPAPLKRASGSVRGRMVNPPAAGLRVEMCVQPVQYISGNTPCAGQSYHPLTNMDAQGNFLFEDVPPGRYFLMLETAPHSWAAMVKSSSDPFAPNPGAEFEVKPGVETQLSEITTARP